MSVDRLHGAANRRPPWRGNTHLATRWRASSAGQGQRPASQRDHLSKGDIAIVMLRRRLQEAVRDVAEGRDPPGVTFDEDAPPIEIEAHGMMPYQPEAAA